jgi:cold shock CspA family protein
MERQRGVICGFLSAKGFGFISQGEGKTFKKIFFHITDFKSETSVVGAQVMFDVSPIPQGPCPTALNVEIVLPVSEVQS